jgi:hypothetical protein
MFEVIRGNKYGRQLKIGANENYVVVELSHYKTDPSKSRNGEVVIVGDPTKSCKIVLTDYEARGFFGKTVEFIAGIQLKELLQGVPAQDTPVQDVPVKEAKQPVEIIVQVEQAIQSGSIPIVPGKGKFGGKTADNIPSGQRKWFVETYEKKEGFSEFVNYLKGEMNK